MHLLRALTLLLAFPVAAEAAPTISVSSGERLQVNLVPAGSGAGQVAASVTKLPDGGALVALYGGVASGEQTVGTGCAATSTTNAPRLFSEGYGSTGRSPVLAATCTMTGVRTITGRISLQPFVLASWVSDFALPTTIDGGRPPGNPGTQETGGLTITTGDGGDTIGGSLGADFIDPGGAPGKGEAQFPQTGNASIDDPLQNTVNGLAGGDRIEMRRAPGVDIVNGGDGVDLVTYANRFASVGSPGAIGVNVSLDGVANDGDPDAPRAGTTTLGEADNIRADVENVLATKLDDTLIGSSLANRFEGLDGVDTLRTGDGQDVIVSREPSTADVGTADVISCGAANVARTFAFATTTTTTKPVPPDTLISDLADPRPFDCENVDQMAVDEGAAVRYPKRAVLAGSDLTVKLACPKAAKRRCRGKLNLAGVKGSTPFAIAAGARRAVVLATPGKVRKALKKHPKGQVHVQAVEKGNEGDVTTGRLLDVS